MQAEKQGSSNPLCCQELWGIAGTLPPVEFQCTELKPSLQQQVAEYHPKRSRHLHTSPAYRVRMVKVKVS